MYNFFKQTVFIFVITGILFISVFTVAEIVARKFYKKSNVMNPFFENHRHSDEKLIEIYKKNGHDWIDEFLDEYNKIEAAADSFTYAPFRIYKFNSNINSKYINAKDGNRPTYVNVDNNCEDIKKIFILGGSTIHGDGWLRDEDLINIQLGKIMKSQKHKCYEIYNRGSSGYNSTQNFIRFFENDISSNSIYIFFDGINDFMHNYYGNVEHLWQNEMAQFVKVYALKENTAVFFIKKILLRSKFFQFLNDKILDKDEIINQNIGLKNIKIKKQKRMNDHCKKWSNRSSAINEVVKKNGGKTFFIWQITVGKYKNIHPNDKKIENITQNAFNGIFEHYEDTRKMCVKSFKLKNIEMIDLPNDLTPEKEMFFDFAHLLPYGNYLIAEQMYNVIKQEL